MAFEWAPVITGTAVLSGVVVTGIFTLINNSRQAKAQHAHKLEEEKRARTRDVLVKVAEALAQVPLLGPFPENGRYALKIVAHEELSAAQDEWTARFAEAIVHIQVATLEIQDRELRIRLGEVIGVLKNSNGLSRINVSEGNARSVAVHHGMECVGEVLRGDPVSPQAAAFKETLRHIDLYFESMGD